MVNFHCDRLVIYSIYYGHWWVFIHWNALFFEFQVRVRVPLLELELKLENSKNSSSRTRTRTRKLEKIEFQNSKTWFNRVSKQVFNFFWTKFNFQMICIVKNLKYYQTNKFSPHINIDVNEHSTIENQCLRK